MGGFGNQGGGDEGHHPGFNLGYGGRGRGQFFQPCGRGRGPNPGGGCNFGGYGGHGGYNYGHQGFRGAGRGRIPYGGGYGGGRGRGVGWFNGQHSQPGMMPHNPHPSAPIHPNTNHMGAPTMGGGAAGPHQQAGGHAMGGAPPPAGARLQIGVPPLQGAMIEPSMGDTQPPVVGQTSSTGTMEAGHGQQAMPQAPTGQGHPSPALASQGAPTLQHETNGEGDLQHESARAPAEVSKVVVPLASENDMNIDLPESSAKGAKKTKEGHYVFVAIQKATPFKNVLLCYVVIYAVVNMYPSFALI